MQKVKAYRSTTYKKHKNKKWSKVLQTMHTIQKVYKPSL